MRRAKKKTKKTVRIFNPKNESLACLPSCNIRRRNAKKKSRNIIKNTIPIP